jgi:hypothetical protein
MRGKASISILLLLATAGLMAQQPVSSPHSDSEKEKAGTAVTRAALKGCLSATAVGAYRLADDETGAVYSLVGNRETLRMLVGTDVLVTGQKLEAGPRPSEEQSNHHGSAVEIEKGSPSYPISHAPNSFRVVDAVKVADVCFLSTSQSAFLLPR